MQRFGLGLIREKLDITQGAAIALTVIAMNLERLLQLLFVFLPSAHTSLSVQGSMASIIGP